MIFPTVVTSGLNISSTSIPRTRILCDLKLLDLYVHGRDCLASGKNPSGRIEKDALVKFLANSIEKEKRFGEGEYFSILKYALEKNAVEIAVQLIVDGHFDLIDQLWIEEGYERLGETLELCFELGIDIRPFRDVCVEAFIPYLRGGENSNKRRWVPTIGDILTKQSVDTLRKVEQVEAIAEILDFDFGDWMKAYFPEAISFMLKANEIGRAHV